jgi:hypothetical protein
VWIGTRLWKPMTGIICAMTYAHQSGFATATILHDHEPTCLTLSRRDAETLIRLARAGRRGLPIRAVVALIPALAEAGIGFVAKDGRACLTDRLEHVAEIHPRLQTGDNHDRLPRHHPA